MTALLIVLITTSVLVVLPVTGQSCKRRVCYYSDYGLNDTYLNTEDIDTQLCSHILYLEGYIEDKGIRISDARVGRTDRLADLKKKNTDLKVLLAAKLGIVSDSFSKYLKDERYRRAYAARTIRDLRKLRFDGLDVEVKDNTFVQLIESTRQAFDNEKSASGKLLLTASVYIDRIADDKTFKNTVGRISPKVDWLSLFAVGEIDTSEILQTATHLAALYSSGKADDSKVTVDAAITNWVKRGIPKHKIVLGLLFYGALYTNGCSQTKEGVTPNKAKPHDINIYSSSGIEPYLYPYYEICKRMDKYKIVPRYFKKQETTYLVSDKMCFRYDDMDSLTQRLMYMKKHGLAGFAAFSIDHDDVKGRFCRKGPYPLLKRANKVCLS